MSGATPPRDAGSGDSAGRTCHEHDGASDAEEVGGTEARTVASTADAISPGSPPPPDAAAQTNEPVKTCNLCQLEFPRSQFKMLSGGRTASYCTPCTTIVCRYAQYMNIRAVLQCTPKYTLEAPLNLPECDSFTEQ
jgi:hypothetical protein